MKSTAPILVREIHPHITQNGKPKHVNKYLQEIKPLLLILRIFGRYPFLFEDGRILFKPLSWPVWYSVFIVIVHLFGTCYIMDILVALGFSSQDNFDDTFYFICLAASVVQSLAIPFTYWRESFRTIKYISDWNHFQEEFGSDELDFSLTKPVRIVSILHAPLLVIMTFGGAYLFDDVRVIIFSPVITALGSLSASMLIFCATLYELRSASKKLLKRIITTGCRNIYKNRILWLKLSNLTTSFGETIGHIGLLALVLLFTAFVLVTYGILILAIDHSFNKSFCTLLSMSLLCISTHFVVCDAAYRTTNALGEKFSYELSELSTSTMSPKDQFEITLFLQTIMKNPPLVHFIGFITIDRSLLVKLHQLVEFKDTGNKQIDIGGMMIWLVAVAGNLFHRMKQGAMSKAWVTIPDSNTKSYSKIPDEKYFHEIKPLLILQRTFGQLPYYFNKEGFASFKFFSLPVFYTVIFILVQTAWTFYSLRLIVHEKIRKAPSYDVTLYWVSFGLLLLLNFSTPVTRWMDARTFVRHVSSWQDFQNNNPDSELKPNITLLLKIFSILIMPAASFFIYIQSYLLTDLSLFVMVPYVFAFVETGVIVVHWSAVLYELRAASRKLLNKMIKDGCSEMSAYRKSWLQLSKLVSGVGESLGHTALKISIILFVTFVLTMYALLSSIFGSKSTCNHIWGLLINTILSLLCNFFLCNAAHLTTHEVGLEFSSKVLSLDLTHLSQSEINEMYLLQQTITANPPTVEYLGFVTVNRNLFVSLISNAVTYLIVLIQFKSSPPIQPSNEIEQ